ncbi:hypothetical protein HYS31_03055 [Candidatus Woesearchaeota archaeon]|nr:hypothetical protein [Candidatus Woesearchaeota archaeon]
MTIAIILIGIILAQGFINKGIKIFIVAKVQNVSSHSDLGVVASTILKSENIPQAVLQALKSDGQNMAIEPPVLWLALYRAGASSVKEPPSSPLSFACHDKSVALDGKTQLALDTINAYLENQSLGQEPYYK